MIPIDFAESNKTLAKPQGWTDEQCGELPVYSYHGGIVSCWRPSLRERLSLLLFGRLWVNILTRIGTQPPIGLLATRKYFLDSIDAARKGGKG